ncbi:MAG TPA: DUF4249 domain-containing protein [Chryseolinea sp.]|nr:DUF4249 domain-containing protein [Flavobacteriales bacterium]HPM31389.1 DUF4249 domain-containing protein [Chryseolinea sp.]
MKNILLIIVSIALLTACEKTIDLDLEQSESKIVIEGLVTNHTGYQYVRVTRTAGFYDDGATPRVTNANVSVKDDTGNEFLFIHNPGNEEDSAGYYLPDVSFNGEIGRTYTLTVEVDGEIYTAQDKLFATSGIDSLGYQINPDEEEDPKEDTKFYEALLYMTEPQDEENYYLFKFFRNDSLKVYNDNDIYFADDKILGETIEGLGSPVYYALNDTARIEMYSISRAGYIYYLDLQSLMNNDGGLFSQPPSNSRNNLSNGALGFFQASAVDVKTILIEE